MNGITLTYEQAGKLDDFLTSVRQALDPEFQISARDKAIVQTCLDGNTDLAHILAQAQAIHADVISPWVKTTFRTHGAGRVGYLGNINGPGCDPDTV